MADLFDDPAAVAVMVEKRWLDGSLSANEIAALVCISAAAKPLRAPDLKAQLRWGRQKTAKALARLVRSGLVERRRIRKQGQYSDVVYVVAPAPAA